MPNARVGQLRLYCEAEGDERPVLLLHELGGSAETWSELWRPLVPALVLGGEHDVLFALEHAPMLAGALPQATYHVIPGAGHFPPFQTLVLSSGAAPGGQRG